LGIGTSSPSEAIDVLGGKIKATNAANTVYQLISADNNGGVLQTGSNAMRFFTSGSEAMRINSSGNVGIGTTSPRAKTEVFDTDVSGVFDAGNLSTWRVMQVRNNIESNTGTAAGIALGGDGTGDTDTAGIVGISDNSTGGVCQLAFITSTGNNSIERMRIDSSGRALVNLTGPVALSSAKLQVSGTSAPAALLNRTDDGDQITFHVNGSAAVGSIGAHSTQTYIGTGDTGLYFNAGNDSIDPYNTSTPVARSDAISLGAASRKFKDLYLSGGVYLGGTGAANKLDDYEEGTWTISFGGGTVSPTNSTGYYTKIGNRVFIQYYSGSTTITGASGSAFFSGLPFSVATGSYTYQPFYTTHNTFFGGSTSVGIDGFFLPGASQGNFMELGSTSAVSLTNGSGLYIMIAGSYYAA
jgi:hypothetical protein